MRWGTVIEYSGVTGMLRHFIHLQKARPKVRLSLQAEDIFNYLEVNQCLGVFTRFAYRTHVVTFGLQFRGICGAGWFTLCQVCLRVVRFRWC